nr:MAG TPA: hypothetical protein [Caudoviricetes sp.]
MPNRRNNHLLGKMLGAKELIACEAIFSLPVPKRLIGRVVANGLTSKSGTLNRL